MSELTASSVTCNHCGAPLAIQPSTRFVHCTHCGARLEIHRSGNALYTEVLESIDRRTQAIAQDVDAIRRETEIERLDREWAMRRDELMVRGKHGSTSTPSAAAGVGVIIVSVLFGGFWMSVAAGIGAPAIFPAFGLIFIGAGVVSGISMIAKSGRYADEQRRYEQRRAALLRGDGDDAAAAQRP